MRKKALVAFGGNALIKENQKGTVEEQFENAAEAADLVVHLLEQDVTPVLVHGNGPQVGRVLLRQEDSAKRYPPMPLDVCGAKTQGSMGYMLQRSIESKLRLKNLTGTVVPVLTEVVVDQNDPGFQNPTKPVGPFLSAEQAEQRQRERGWVVKEDSGRGWRRVVASPVPREILQFEAIKVLSSQYFIVIACGGGGIPVVREPTGELTGVEAVIDKDLTAALLAQQLTVAVYIVLTGVEKVSLNFGKPNQQDLDRLTLSEARQYLADGQFPPGSMGPKIQSAIEYIEQGGQEVLITTAEALLKGTLKTVGTRIVPD